MSKKMRKINNVKNWKQFMNEQSNSQPSDSQIDYIISELDNMNVEYELSKNKYKPFKVIYKPINKSDEFYRRFNDIIYRYNLESAVFNSLFGK